MNIWYILIFGHISIPFHLLSGKDFDFIEQGADVYFQLE